MGKDFCGAEGLCTCCAPESGLPLLWNGNPNGDGFCIGAKTIGNSNLGEDFFSRPREKEGDLNVPNTGAFLGGTIVPNRGFGSVVLRGKASNNEAGFGLSSSTTV